MEDYVIYGEYRLPSLGKVYKTDVCPNIKIRSMTVNEEMKRLNSTEKPYKVLSDIIDDCLVDNIGISSYDLCLGDFQFLLHRLRVVTYGSKYKLVSKCPYCGFDNNGEIDLLDIPVKEYSSEAVDKYLDITLPTSKYRITLLMQTPRMLDEIQARTKELASKRKTQAKDSAFLLNIEYPIETVNGTKLDIIKKSDFVKSLPLPDINYLTTAINKATDSIGLETELENTCDLCELDYKSSFRVTPEFFRPTVEI